METAPSKRVCNKKYFSSSDYDSWQLRVGVWVRTCGRTNSC